MKQLYNKINKSSFNVFGRIACVLAVIASMRLIYNLLIMTNNDKAFALVTAILSPLLIPCVLMCTVTVIAIIIKTIDWAIKGDDSYFNIMDFAGDFSGGLIVFIAKLLFGDWDRLYMFKRPKKTNDNAPIHVNCKCAIKPKDDFCMEVTLPDCVNINISNKCVEILNNQEANKCQQ